MEFRLLVPFSSASSGKFVPPNARTHEFFALGILDTGRNASRCGPRLGLESRHIPRRRRPKGLYEGCPAPVDAFIVSQCETANCVVVILSDDLAEPVWTDLGGTLMEWGPAEFARAAPSPKVIAKPFRGCISAKCTAEELSVIVSVCAFHGNAPTQDARSCNCLS